MFMFDVYGNMAMTDKYHTNIANVKDHNNDYDVECVKCKGS